VTHTSVTYSILIIYWSEECSRKGKFIIVRTWLIYVLVLAIFIATCQITKLLSQDALEELLIYALFVCLYTVYKEQYDLVAIDENWTTQTNIRQYKHELMHTWKIWKQNDSKKVLFDEYFMTH
jgi:Mn2+/Fe2+ NRAMP family transporter